MKQKETMELIPSSKHTPIYIKVLFILSFTIHLSFLYSIVVDCSREYLGGSRTTLKGPWDSFFHDADRVELGLDFFSIYQAGFNFRKGLPIYFGVREYPFDKKYYVVPYYSGFRYLPFYACSFGFILTLFTPWTSFFLWLVCIELFFIFNLYLLKYTRSPRQIKIVAACFWLAYTPYYVELHIGQQSMVTVTLLHLAGIFHEHRRFKLRDISYIFSALWKMNTLLLLPVWIRLRRYTTIFILFVLILLLSFPYFISVHGTFSEFLSYFKHKFIATGPNSLGLWSLSGALATHFNIDIHSLRMFLSSMNIFFWFSGFLMILMCRNISFLYYFSLWIIMYFMTYQYVWEHHYILLLPVFSLLFTQTFEKKWIIWGLFCLLPTPYYLFNIPASSFPQEQWGIIQDFFVHGTKVIPLMTMLFYLFYRIVKERNQQSPDQDYI